jgi:hypothetical protein
MADIQMSKSLCLSGEANPLVDEVEADIWQTYRETTQFEENNLKPGKLFLRGSAVGVGNTVFVQYNCADGKTRNTVYKEAL